MLRVIKIWFGVHKENEPIKPMGLKTVVASPKPRTYNEWCMTTLKGRNDFKTLKNDLLW
jgi:hypothetical protein